jgi:large exoprotein involved in heme utilization and adhesion
MERNSTLLGIQQNSATENNRSNDIDASSRFSLDGNIKINTPDNNLIQGVTELSTEVIVPEETTQQACQAKRESAAQNGLTITGKGGILPDPGNALNSLNTYVDGESTSAKSIPAPIETAQGKIQPASGIEITESGEIILTAYRTNNSGERLPEGSRNCGRV